MHLAKNSGILMEWLQPLENDTNPIKIQGVKDSNHWRRPFFDLRNDCLESEMLDHF